ncbi:MAG: MlaC/ttg2D family ABC transporter substrate-binding protein [Pseudomonadales bacterium]
MFKRSINKSRLGLALSLILTVGATMAFGAQQSDSTPYLIVKNTTEQVLAEIEAAKEYFDDDPQRFYNRIDTILSEVTDFYSFSRSVMGFYASKRSMNALDEAGKEKLEQQIDRFVDKFHDGLVNTYAKGLLNFSGQRIEVVKPRGNDGGSKSVVITQHIYGDASQPYVVQFKMRRDRDDAWKVRNVTIEAINLGKIFREQFASEARKYDSNLDLVIDNWSSETAAKEVEGVRKGEDLKADG